ncbi:T9SS type A sorting domain-containing protein [Flavobacterium sp. SUN052]|uniref:MopE-related protein n=1 Tax=Flavobacterium sp. SUN052 TaxID=3002441 RepID=UPI00237E4538|nr:T9SS type A sorting domain-containing protein [Flavobacterium sp. SUN052]MEC4005926.1 T9SS type A sorting domain-containing protein [Flavobacterium sp. SUN052]
MKKIFLLFFLMTISLGQSQTPAAGPTSPPARNAWDVLSQYGSAYTNQSGVVFDSFGGSTIVGDVTLADNSVVKKYTGHSYSGISTNGAFNLNVASMTKLHIDVWSPDFVSFKIKLEAVNGSNVELEVPFTKSQGSWNSYDLDLSTYSAVDLANLRWIVPVTFGPNNTTLFITNVYFWRPATIQPPTLGSFSVPAQSVGAAPFSLTAPTSNSAGAFTYSSSNTNVATISGSTVTLVGGGTSTITATQAADGSYGSASAAATLTVSYPAPGPSPTPPTRAANTVVSMFTGTPPAYANVVNAVRAPWTAGTTLTTIPNGTDTCLQVDNFGYLGYITPGANFSAAGMTKLHVDVYLNTPIANMFIFLLSNGDQLYNTGALVAGWNSLDITLGSAYPGANLADIYGFKFEHNQGAARQIYLDNIYFYVAGSDPVITDFTVPAKVFGDAPFALTAPTSTSAGAFTYTSSNPSVATISGNVVTVIGIGTSTITANQAADGSFDAGSTTASLVVSAPPLTTPAPTPPVRNSYDVISLYSDAYTNVPSAAWQGASTLTDELLSGNPTKKMSNFLVEFINFSATDVSQMTMLHMDVYTSDCTGFNIWLLNNGDRNAQFFPSLNGWYSVDIPLSTYVNNGLNMTGLIQLKFEGLNGPGKTVYVDNVYFYRPATLPPATVGVFTVPAKNVGDANFAITPPTSNNSSPFTYTSSANSVATIVGGNQIHIVSGGTSTITATQVSDGTYGPTSKTATFVVSFPAPGPSPIPPARTPSRVMSMYTGTPSVYTTTPNYSLGRAFWTAGATLNEIPNGTNTALRVDNLGYIGLIDVVSERRLNVSAMTNLHLDVYVNAPFANLFFWLLTDGDQRRDITNLVAGWNSIDIPLSEFAGANLSNVYGLKFEQNQPAPLQIYLDNIYFSDDTHYADVDGDGYGNLAAPVVGQPIGSVLDATDCDDTRASVHPGATDVCYDGLDNDCNGNVDNVGLPGGCTPKVANLPTATCGSTVNALNTVVSATNVPGAQAFRFKITNMTTNAVQTLDSPTISFQFSSLPGVTFGTQYKIEVAIKFAGVWQGFYGSPCFVNTPSPVSIISAAQCGSTLTSMSQYINSSYVANVTGYRYEVTNQSNGQTQYVYSSLNKFTLTQLLASNQTFNTNYFIRVSCRNTDGTYLPEGPGCIIKSRAFPTTQVIATQCNNYLVPSMATNINVDLVSGATLYKFRLFNGTYDFVVESVYNKFTLNMFPGIEQGATYSVQIAAQVGGIFDLDESLQQKWGKTCTLTTPGAARQAEGPVKPIVEIAVNEFTALAYPNPFAENFKLKVTTNSDENVSVRVYDMLGKLVEDRKVNATDVETLEVGAGYQTGVYNVIVTQGENTKSVRVIKR